MVILKRKLASRAPYFCATMAQQRKEKPTALFLLSFSATKINKNSISYISILKIITEYVRSRGYITK